VIQARRYPQPYVGGGVISDRVTQNMDAFIMNSRSHQNLGGGLVDMNIQSMMDHVKSRISKLIHEIASGNSQASDSISSSSTSSSSSLTSDVAAALTQNKPLSQEISTKKLDSAILAAERTAQLILNIKLNDINEVVKEKGIAVDLNDNGCPLSEEQLKDIALMCFRVCQ
jgi:hypothetical protein